MAIDLTPDLSANLMPHWNLIRHGKIRIENRFESAMTERVNCHTYIQ